MRNTKIALLISSIILLSSCSKDEWEGFVYPDKNNLTIHKNIGVFDSLENCRAEALNTLSQISSIQRGDYECGLNCQARNEHGGIKVCEKTVR